MAGERSRFSPGRLLRRLCGLVFVALEALLHRAFALAYGRRGDRMPPVEDVALLESASGLALKIRTGKVRCVDVLESFVERIREVNPLLNCVVADRFDEAREEARRVDELVASKLVPVDRLETDKPFLGVPFTTKDCIPIKGMIHTSGLLKRRSNVAAEDARVVSLLREAGAIPIALTNVSELCMWWESANNVHGRSSNPYDTNRIVGGSSGGEGCAQAASCSAFGIGSDIGGSIRMPSFFNGIFGHKPSPGMVSNHGQYPQPVTEEHSRLLGLGPMCRRAEDLLPLMKVLSDKNREKLRLDEAVDVKKLRYFYQDTDAGSMFVSPVSTEIRELFGKISRHLDKAYGIRANKVRLRDFSKGGPMWFATMKSPDGPTFPQQLANMEGAISPWRELLRWSLGRSEHTFIGIVTCLAEARGGEHGDEAHRRLAGRREALRAELLALLGDDGVFLYPTHPTSAPYHNEPLFKPFNFSYTAVINCLRLPATHCPMGLDGDGLPIGVQVVAAEGNDRLCLAVAGEIERAFGGWTPVV